MKNYFRKFLFNARILFALLAVTFFIPTVHAQDESLAGSRYLFIFGTSSDMKPREKATRKEITTLLSTAMRGQLLPDDTIGIWTLGENLRIGQIPLLSWQPAEASKMADLLQKFIGKQRYSGTIDFRKLQPLLDQVIEASPRLTILIFCDGESAFAGTPYDAEINQTFKQHGSEQKKSKVPFVIALRTQQGKYIGASVNFPPGMVNLPQFPPLPNPAPLEPPAPAPVPVAKPSVPAAPLVIIGTKIETNWAAYQFALTNTPPPQTNLPSVQSAKTNSVAATNAISAPVTNFVTVTNTVLARENSNAGGKGVLILAIGLLIAAIILISLFIFFRSRRANSASLISRSMKK